MALLTAAFSVIALGLAVLSFCAMRGARTRWGARGILVLFFCLGMGTYLTQIASLGKPRPIAFFPGQLADEEERVVLGARVVPGEAIFLWLEAPATDEPLSLRLPFDENTARELRRARREAGDRRLMMRRGGPDHEGSGETRFYPEPHLDGLPKDHQDERDTYTAPSWSI